MAEILAKIRERSDTASRWAAFNPVLLKNERGHETDTLKSKNGDGVTAWNNLAYRTTGAGEKGEKGDPFLYEDFTPTQLNLLKGSDGQDGADGADGQDGASFTVDKNGDLSGRDAFDTEAEGFSYLDTVNGNLYIKNSATSGDWSNPIPFGKGEKGDSGFIETWSAKSFTSGNQVFHEGKIYESNANTVVGDVPGVSDKWDAKIDGGVGLETRKSYNLVDFKRYAQKGNWSTSGSYSASNSYISTKKMPIGNLTVKSIQGVGKLGSTVPRVTYFNSTGDKIGDLTGGVYKDSLSFPQSIPAPPAGTDTYAVTIASGSNIGLDLENSPYAQTFMINEGSIAFPFEKFGEILIEGDEKFNYYVDASLGSDSNIGNLQFPFKTVSYAISKIPKKDINIADGDYFDVGSINNCTLKGSRNVRLISGEQITSATLVSGKVWKADENIATKNQDYELWQHDISDPKSEIILTERHSIQGDRTHRLPSTILHKAASIQEIESSNDLMWYHDGTTFYFSKTTGSDLSANPIVIPSLGNSITVATKIIGISLLYRGFNVTASGDLLVDGSSILFCNEDPMYNNGGKSIIKNSRIGGCHNNGMGYGEHAVGEEYNNWVHDCLDEGSSAHGFSNIIRKGGYFEHNVTAIIDVGNVISYIENVLMLNNVTGAINFSYYEENGQNKGSAIVFNCGSDQGVSTNTAGRVKVINSSFADVIASNITVI